MERIHIVDPTRSKTDKSGFFHKINSFLAILAELIITGITFAEFSKTLHCYLLLNSMSFIVVEPCSRTLQYTFGTLLTFKRENHYVEISKCCFYQGRKYLHEINLTFLYRRDCRKTYFFSSYSKKSHIITSQTQWFIYSTQQNSIGPANSNQASKHSKI